MGWNSDALRKGHDQFLARHQRAVREASERAAKHAEDHVSRYPKFKPRTGALQRATETQVIKTRGGTLIRIGNRKPYADAIDAGARPHVIAARRAPMLVFFWAKVGRLVFTRKVNHPGNRPYKFLYRATQSADRVLKQELERGMAEAARKF